MFGGSSQNGFARLFPGAILVAMFVAGGVFLGRSLETSRSGKIVEPASPTHRDPNPLATIRIATWNLTPLNFGKVRNPARWEMLLTILSDFDVVALQGVTGGNDAVLIELVDTLRRRGKRMTFARSQTIATTPEYLAFLYDPDRVMIDRATLAEVVDFEGRFAIRPLAASFRTTEPLPEKAFTFTLVNVKLDPERAAAERELLPDVYRSFRDDPRGEDDILFLGSFSLPVHESGAMATMPDIFAVHHDLATTIDGRAAADNVLFPRRATTEYVERFGIVDFVRAYGLDIDEAANLAEHFPLWADFSVFESGQP